MYIKEDMNGFRGMYNRATSQIYLDESKFGGKTLEPLHLLLEEATNDKWEERPNMDRCIDLLKHEIKIIQGKLSLSIERQYECDEKRKKYETNVGSDSRIYEEAEKVEAFFKDMLKNITICINDGLSETLISPYLMKRIAPKLFLFIDQVYDGYVLRYALHISRIEMREKEILVRTKVISEEQGKLLKGEYIKISGNYEAKVISKV